MAEASGLHNNDQIKNLVPLNTLPEAQLSELLRMTEVEKAFKGDFLFHAGDIDQQNVYLLTGEVALLVDERREMDRVSAESEVARYPLSHQFPRKFSARATQAASFVRVDNRKLSALLSRSQAAGYRVEELDTGEPGDWMDQLLGSRVVQLMPTANIQEVLRHMEKVELAKDQVVFHQGAEGDFYYFISEGRCRLTRTDEEGGEPQEIAQLGPGDSFGEDALLSGMPRSCTITMLNDGVLLRLSKENFLDLIKKPLSRSYSYGEAKRLVNAGATWLDVRSAMAHDKAHISGSINLPFDLLRYQMSSLDVDRDYIVYCDDEGISSAAAYLLTERGFKVSVLKRGLAAVLPRDLVSAATKAEQEEAAAQPDPRRDAGAPEIEPEAPIAPDRSTTVAGGGESERVEERLLAEQQRALELVQRLRESEARWQQAEQRYIDEIAELKQALSLAQDAAGKGKSQAAVSPQGGDADTAALRRALQKAETKLAKLTEEYEEAEELHAAETEEMHRLWEKRLGKLEAQVEDQQEQIRKAVQAKDAAEQELRALQEGSS